MDMDVMTVKKQEWCMKMDYVLNARRRDISEETVHKDKKKAPVASFSPRKMKGKDTHTHIKALVALMDED